jgi:hypothetical protein
MVVVKGTRGLPPMKNVELEQLPSEGALECGKIADADRDEKARTSPQVRRSRQAASETKASASRRPSAVVGVRSMIAGDKPFALVTSITRSEGGNQGGVYFLESPLGTVVLKPESYWLAAFSLQLARRAGIGAPDSVLLEYDPLTFAGLAQLPNGQALIEAIEAHRDAYGPRILLMEKIEGRTLKELDAAAAAALFAGEHGAKRLKELGAIGAFDIASRNADRFGIWYDVPITNSANVIFRESDGAPLGIDQGFMFPSRPEELLRFMKDRLERLPEWSARIRDQIREDTGHDVGAAGAASILAGFQAGVKRIASLSAADVEAVLGATRPREEGEAAYLDRLLALFRRAVR